MGEAVVSERWTFFGPYDSASLKKESEGGKDPGAQYMAAVPKIFTAVGCERTGVEVVSRRGQLDLTELLPNCDHTEGVEQKQSVGYVYISVSSSRDQEAVTFGIGGYRTYGVWLNGVHVLEKPPKVGKWPPAMNDNCFSVALVEGENLFVIRLDGSKGGIGDSGSLLAFGGPGELARGDFRSIVDDPFGKDPAWASGDLRAEKGAKGVVEIGGGRELFVDDHIIDAIRGPVALRLNPAVPAEVVLAADRPWEGETNTYYNLVDAGDGRSYLYYRGSGKRGGKDNRGGQFTCIAETSDGVHFERLKVGLVEFEGSKDNNILPISGESTSNFTVFRDTRPDVPEDQLFKAMAFHPTERFTLSSYVSPDGLNWRLLQEKPVLRAGYFDSQNVSFWDARLGCYVSYSRDNIRGQRLVQRSVSEDFVNWSKPELLSYADDRDDDLYTNAIQSYPLAPHLYIGFPARFIRDRRLVADASGISDGLFMSSRDGTHFHRWVTPIVRPDIDPEVWTTRNNYPAAGLHMTSPTMMSLYWSEHYRHPTNRLRRGTLRTDGFTCLCETGAAVGEVLTRPFTFSGSNLVVNYSTSVVGSIRFGLCDEQGHDIPGFRMEDSEVLYGNAINQTVRWAGNARVDALAGRPVRLRVRMFDAEWYAFQFVEGKS